MPVREKDIQIPKYCVRVLCFDTETTGLLPRHIPGTPFPPESAYPYITQLSWVMYNLATGEIEEVVDEYIKIPAEVKISEESTKVSGITREILDEKGVDLTPLLARFYSSYMKCDSIVAHNMNFDKEMIRQEMRRNKLNLLQFVRDRDRVNTMLGIGTKKLNSAYEIELFCTMMNTIELCDIEWTPTAKFPSIIKPHDEDLPVSHVSKPARKKWPTLTELYTKVFDKAPPSDLHNSIIDVLVCLRCFLKIRGATEMPEEVFEALIEKYSRSST